MECEEIFTVQVISSETVYVSGVKRSCPKKKKVQNLDTLAEKLKIFQTNAELFVDGPNCVGKSTLVNNIANRTPSKLSKKEELPKGTVRNLHASAARAFLFIHLLYKNPKSVCDRCPLSNAVFFFVTHLMNEYESVDIPIEPCTEVNDFLNKLAQIVKLPHIITMCLSFKPQAGYLFLINSDINMMTLNLMLRGERHDMNYAQNYNYAAAQIVVYRWFSSMVPHSVLVDINDYVGEEDPKRDWLSVMETLQKNCALPKHFEANYEKTDEDALKYFTEFHKTTELSNFSLMLQESRK